MIFYGLIINLILFKIIVQAKGFEPQAKLVSVTDPSHNAGTNILVEIIKFV